jgi:sugar lactone lactonase YvrE
MHVSARTAAIAAAAAAAIAVVAAGLATANPLRPSPPQSFVKGKGDLSWTTVFKSPRAIEGLTADQADNLYTADRGTPCSVLRIPAGGGAAVVVGRLNVAPCGPSGLTFGPDGRLYVTNSDGRIYVLAPDAASPPDATVFAEGVPGTNGLAFDRGGNLWTGDGTTGQGRVWMISPSGTVTEELRVPPLANGKGIGRQPLTLQGAAPPATNPQTLVANGVAFAEDGSLLVADTARGAIWQVDLDGDGNVLSPTGCDSTFTADTLCLDDVLVQNPSLEGADGIALDRAGNIWTAANERNAIVVVSHKGDRVSELYRNPVDPATGLRNAGPLETPTSPFLAGRTLCVTQSDGGRRDNAPNAAGEVGPGSGFVAKISCLDQQLDAPGLPLPVR